MDVETSNGRLSQVAWWCVLHAAVHVLTQHFTISMNNTRHQPPLDVCRSVVTQHAAQPMPARKNHMNWALIDRIPTKSNATFPSGITLSGISLINSQY